MLDYRQQRDVFNRVSPTDRRGVERRRAERRGGDRRLAARRRDPGSAPESDQSGDTLAVEHERRRADRRELGRRASERRALSRRHAERRRDPKRLRRFPGSDGFLTSEERDFLMSVMHESRDDQS